MREFRKIVGLERFSVETFKLEIFFVVGKNRVKLEKA